MSKPLLLLLVVALPLICRAQQVPQAQVYQLASAIVEQLRSSAYVAARKGTDGTYHTVQYAKAGDTLLVRLLLLDHPYSLQAVERLVKAGEQTPEHTTLRQYFSSADIAFMQQQLPAAHAFRFEQSRIQQPWAKVLPLDTLHALQARLERQLGWLAELRFADTLARHYGNTKSFAIGGMLFSKDRNKALATVSSRYGSYTAIYRKTGAIWRQGEILYSVVE